MNVYTMMDICMASLFAIFVLGIIFLMR